MRIHAASGVGEQLKKQGLRALGPDKLMASGFWSVARFHRPASEAGTLSGARSMIDAHSRESADFIMACNRGE